ncbi:MAG: rhomboid family intramembrane serine protease [Shackletoniella antarctica]|uniref:Rhomboid family intramembrane serine protease n=1 Tax=Shackletoniella antarctica TaxID=268115 RepID=A0A2W4VYG7_9CYAN|nr:MAG: rhomboid family intramembrane serine protease [Shackletoniella antarctica]
MVPLHDDNPTTLTPVVIYGLIGLNIAVFVFQLNLSQQGLDSFFDAWALVPTQLTESFEGALEAPAYEWITLVSSQFLHGGFFHVGGNLLYLWVFGNNIEDQLGHVKFLIFYLGCGVLAGLTQWVFDPYSAIPTIGASGAIAGVMGAYILRFPRASIVTLIPLIIFFTTIRIPAIFFLGFWFVQQALFSLASLSSDVNLGAGGVAYWAHSGGFVFGLILGPLLGLMGSKSRSPRR